MPTTNDVIIRNNLRELQQQVNKKFEHYDSHAGTSPYAQGWADCLDWLGDYFECYFEPLL